MKSSRLGKLTSETSKQEEISKELSSPLDSGLCSDLALSTFDSEELSDKPCVSFSPSHKESSGSKIFDSGLGLEPLSPSIKDSSTKDAKEELKETLSPPIDWTQFYITDEDFDTSLHILVAQGNHEAVFEVLRCTPEPKYLDLYNIDYQTALHIACITQQPRIIRRLVVCGVTIDFQDVNGNTPLHLACCQSNLDVLLALTTPILEPEVSAANCLYPVKVEPFPNEVLDMKNNDGKSCIHLAVENNETKIVEMLYQLGADMNSQEGICGRTPLHLAVLNQNLDMLRTLVKVCDIDVNAPNYAGHTAFQETHDNTIKQYLLKYGAEPMTPDSSDSSDSSDYEDEEQGKVSNACSGISNRHKTLV